MIWHVTVGCARYLTPEEAGAGPILRPYKAYRLVVVASDRRKAEELAAQMAARHGMPIWAETEYDW